ncbi:hypothetical protein PI124_g3270 [Phytophthora idaei]|nr:hypothetical protein PI125_g13454 [Phytophthora idaei]KAG3252140.1 hypothetical protein PI124_g3270 [Phytophthora idaei]
MAPSPSSPNQTADKPPSLAGVPAADATSSCPATNETTQEASGEDQFPAVAGASHENVVRGDPIAVSGDGTQTMSTSIPSKSGASASGSSTLRLSQAQARLASPSLHHSSSVPTRMPASFVARHVGYPDPSHRPPPLVDVPATLADLSAGAAVRDGVYGLEMVVEGGCLSDRDLVDLARIIPNNIRRNCLRRAAGDPRGVASSGPVEGLSATAAHILREVVPALKFYGVEDFSRRVRKAPRYIHLLLRTFATWRPLPTTPTSCETLSCVRNTEYYETNWSVFRSTGWLAWFTSLSLSLSSAKVTEETARIVIAPIWRRGISESSDWKSKLHPYGRLRGNWERLLALLEHYRDNPEPPNDWMSRVGVDHLKDADYTASPDPSLQERIVR